MDLQLQLMESEADPAVLAADLPAATVRVEQVVALVRRLRAAVASGLAGLTDDTLTTLSTEMDREVAALHAGVEELRALNRRDAARRADPAAVSRSPPRVDARHSRQKGNTIMSSNTSRVKTIFRGEDLQGPRQDGGSTRHPRRQLRPAGEAAPTGPAGGRGGRDREEAHRAAGAGDGQPLPAPRRARPRRRCVQGREDLARAALERRALLEGQVAKLQQQFSSLDRQSVAAAGAGATSSRSRSARSASRRRLSRPPTRRPRRR